MIKQSEASMDVAPAKRVESAHTDRLSSSAEPVARSGAVDQLFHEGDLLLCINHRNLRRPYIPQPPVEGRVYLVRETYCDDGVPGVLLEGIFCPVTTSNGLECGFRMTRFRLLNRPGRS